MCLRFTHVFQPSPVHSCQGAWTVAAASRSCPRCPEGPGYGSGHPVCCSLLPAHSHQPAQSHPLLRRQPAKSCLEGGGGGGRKGFIGKKKKKRSGVMQGCALEGAARSAGVREGWVGGWAGRGTFPYLLRYPSPCAAAAAALRQPPACRRGADL